MFWERGRFHPGKEVDLSETRGNYAIMLDALADDLPEIEKRIFEALKKHPGGLLRQQLVLRAKRFKRQAGRGRCCG